MLNKLKLLFPILAITFVVSIIYSVTEFRLNEYKKYPDYYKTITMEQREKELVCLARNIYFEAAKEPFEGKVAVAQVVMNRVEDGNFPKNICGVVYQKNKVYEKIICQFSWYCESPSKLKVRSSEAYDESYEVAKKVLLEGFRLSVLDNALYYHADYVNPRWKLKRITKIGAHIFYEKV